MCTPYSFVDALPLELDAPFIGIYSLYFMHDTGSLETRLCCSIYVYVLLQYAPYNRLEGDSIRYVTPFEYAQDSLPPIPQKGQVHPCLPV